MKSQDYGIDVLEIIKHLVNRVWIIVLCTVIAAVAVMPVMGLMPQKSQMQALLAGYTARQVRYRYSRFRRDRLAAGGRRDDSESDAVL